MPDITDHQLDVWQQVADETSPGPCVGCGCWDVSQCGQDDTNRAKDFKTAVPALIAEVRRLREEVDRLDRLARTGRDFQKMMIDLDRNEHGRHERDADCGDPTGVSQGNPHLVTGQIIGHGLAGVHQYVVPPPEQRIFPEAWIVTKERGEHE